MKILIAFIVFLEITLLFWIRQKHGVFFKRINICWIQLVENTVITNAVLWPFVRAIQSEVSSLRHKSQQLSCSILCYIANGCDGRSIIIIGLV